jgi:hypothetical protein
VSLTITKCTFVKPTDLKKLLITKHISPCPSPLPPSPISLALSIHIYMYIYAYTCVCVCVRVCVCVFIHVYAYVYQFVNPCKNITMRYRENGQSVTRSRCSGDISGRVCVCTDSRHLRMVMHSKIVVLTCVCMCVCACGPIAERPPRDGWRHGASIPIPSFDMCARGTGAEREREREKHPFHCRLSSAFRSYARCCRVSFFSSFFSSFFAAFRFGGFFFEGLSELYARNLFPVARFFPHMKVTCKTKAESSYLIRLDAWADIFRLTRVIVSPNCYSSLYHLTVGIR